MQLRLEARVTRGTRCWKMKEKESDGEKEKRRSGKRTMVRRVGLASGTRWAAEEGLEKGNETSGGRVEARRKG